MRSATSVGRIIGALLFVQLAGLTVPFVMLHPLGASASPAHAAESAFQIKVAVLLLLANGALAIGIAFAALAVFRRHGHAMGLLLVAVSVIWFSLQAVDNAHVLSMLTLSQQYAQAGGQDDSLQALAAVVRSTRRWVHHTELLVIDAWMFVLYSTLFHFALVPRALAVVGLFTVILHFAGITVPLFLGHRGVTLMGATMGLSQLALAAWLMVRGLGEGRRPTGAEADVR